jgi:hypothetical protein
VNATKPHGPTKSVSNNSVECSASPFPAVVGSGRWRGVNVSSCFNRAGFTGTRRVLVSAVPSRALVARPRCLGVRGSGEVWWWVWAPAGQVHRRIGVTVGAMPATAAEHAVG